METGEILRIGEQRAPSNGAVLATAGNLIFWGDLNRRLHAYDATTGKQLWEQIVGGSIAVSTITYAVNGKQYVAILTGEGAMTNGLTATQAPELKRALNHTAVYVSRCRSTSRKRRAICGNSARRRRITQVR
jgi:alcohol dehydrogenase (cytochrome c)